MKDQIDLFKYEIDLVNNKGALIAGCDEAGRGPLAGPVYCAAVILDPAYRIEGLNDSKKLTSKERDKLYDEITNHSLAYKVVSIDSETIDRINILEASRLGMEKALEGLKVKPDIIITDYMDLYHTSTSYIKLAHADALCASVAAASILAKVERDRYMVEISKEYPNYGFDKHKGYGTKEHIDAIKKYGVTPIHRKTFKPVSNLLDIQLSFDLDE